MAQSSVLVRLKPGDKKSVDATLTEVGGKVSVIITGETTPRGPDQVDRIAAMSTVPAALVDAAVNAGFYVVGGQRNPGTESFLLITVDGTSAKEAHERLAQAVKAPNDWRAATCEQGAGCRGMDRYTFVYVGKECGV